MTDEKNDKKMPYEKPQVKFVKFVVDEMVFTSCKLSSSGPGGKTPGNACWYQFWLLSCNASGS